MKQMIFSIATSIAIAACSHPAPPAKGVTKPEPANPSGTAALARIRITDVSNDSIVEVKPLRDPAVDGLLKQAHDAEAKGNIAAAIAATTRALSIAKDAPDILQYQAELYIEQGDWKQADATAQKSRDVGPKVGTLCARIQRTLMETRNVTSGDAAVKQAQLGLTSCKVPAPARL